MKTIKIFSIGSHTFIDRVSAVDYVRIAQPMKYLKDYEYGDYKFKVTAYNQVTDPSFDWRDVFRDHDIVYFNYSTNDVAYAVIGTMAQKYKRKIVCDLDDDVFNILQDNVAFETFKEGSWGRKVIKGIIGDVHHATTTNKHLKNSIMFNTQKKSKDVTVIPNYIDLSLYKHRSPFKDRGFYKALHFGSSSHFVSLANDEFYKGMDRIMREYPNFSFTSVGAFLPSYRNRWGRRYQQGFGDTDLMKWIEKMPEIMDDHDFMVVPLNDNIYNRSKSSVKYLEASSYKIPGIYQDIRQYREVVTDGHNGLLATTENEWYNSIKTMIDNTKLRRQMGENAFETVEKEWTIQGNVDKYAEMMINILTNN